jgi:hypothetical protein
VPCNLTHVCCCLSSAGKHEEDPQNTEGTLTDNTDSRVGLKDTTDTTPGYFYKNEVLLRVCSATLTSCCGPALARLQC